MPSCIPARPNTTFYRSEFPAYLKFIGRNATNQFESEHELGNESAIFYAHNNALAAGLRRATATAFNHTFDIALAYDEPLDGGPADWAKAHISLLIHGLRHHFQDWVKNCCDTQPPSNPEQDFEDFIFWKEWRAPRFIRMRPSGNLPYDPSSTWTREDEITTENLLDGLTRRFIWSQEWTLNKLVGDAHVRLVKSPKVKGYSQPVVSGGVTPGATIATGESTCIQPSLPSSEMPKTPTVFISYSHDSETWLGQVLTLSDRLRADGVDCHIDQYETSPPQGWPRWCDKQVREADFVLVVCTKTYLRRFRGEEESGTGLGGTWEGHIITQELYNTQASNTKFLPIIFAAEDFAFIPAPLQGATRYRLLEQYEDLYRRLTSQPMITKPPLGMVKAMPPRHMPALPALRPRESFFAPPPETFSREETIRSGGAHMYNELIATNFISHAVGSSCTVRELIEELAAHSKKRIPIESIRAALSTRGVTRGRVFFGNPGDYLEQILSVYPGARWWISNHGLNIEDKNPDAALAEGDFQGNFIVQQGAEPAQPERIHAWGGITEGRPTVWVAEIEGDDGGDTHRSILMDSLCAHLGNSVDILRAGTEFREEIAGDAAKSAANAHLAAQMLLQDREGNLVVWGKVVMIQSVAYLRLHFSSRALAKARARYIALSELVPTNERASAFAAITAALALNADAFDKEISDYDPNTPVPAATGDAPTLLDHVQWWWSEAQRNAGWVAQATLDSVGAVVAQALQMSGATAGQLGEASGALLNKAGKLGWDLLSQNAPAAENLPSPPSEAP